MEYEVIKNNIVYFKNAVPNHKEIIECIENVDNNIITKWAPWGNKYSTSFEQKDSTLDLYGSGKTIHSTTFDQSGESKDYYWVYESLYKALTECSLIYKDIMNIDESVNPRLETPGFVIGRYDSDKSRGLHSDCQYDDLEHSYVFYLNNDYKGGELEFPELGIIFKPEAGSIVMFKSNEVDNIHQAHISYGLKYIIPHFWRMGPSQGFIPYGTSIDEYINVTTNESNKTHNFDDLVRVSKKNTANEYK